MGRNRKKGKKDQKEQKVFCSFCSFFCLFCNLLPFIKRTSQDERRINLAEKQDKKEGRL